LKLIQVCNIFYPAPLFGTGLTVYKIALKAVQKDIKSVVVTTDLESLAPFKRLNCKDEENYRGVKIRRCKAYKFPKVYPTIVPGLFNALKEEIKNFNGKIVIHSHSYLSLNSFFAALKRKCNKKIKLVHQPHYHPFPRGTWKGYLARKLCDKTIGKFILNNADRIVVMSNAEKEMVKKHNLTDSKFTIIPHGVEPPLNLQNNNRQKFRKRYNIREKEAVLLCVSRIGYEIVDFFIYLLKQLKHTVKVLLVGSLWGNIDKEIIIEKIHKNSIKERLILTGYLPREELPYAYISADIFIKPAFFFEAFGIVFIEAMSYGLPIVTHKIGALPEIISNEENGYLVEHSCDEIADFKGKIESLIEDKKKYKQMSSNNIEKAKNYLWDSALDRYFELYEELLSES